jgi:VIT1/CCC1 family predicted Fe2+/Mn2+ transporter
MLDEVSHAIGELRGRMDSAHQRAERMEGKLDDQGEKIDRVLAALERQRGSRRTTATVITGVGSVVGALGGWLVSWLITRP